MTGHANNPLSPPDNDVRRGVFFSRGLGYNVADMKRVGAAFLLAWMVAGSFPPAPALAQADIDPGRIVSDAEMTDSLAMSRADLERFLAERGSLGNARFPDLDGSVRSAADIIWNASQRFGLSPKFLLVLLQREQSLVEDPSPSQNQLDWAMGYAVCDDCRKDDPAIQKFRGFAAQVHYASQRIRDSYLADLASTGATLTGIGPGRSAMIDGTLVFPENHATAALYTYTPHLHGNLNFARIWRRWFTRDYPTGTLLRGPDGGHWVVQAGARRAVTSRSVLTSRFDESKAIEVTQAALERYPIGDPIRFANYSLLRSPRGTVFLIVDDKKRGITSPEAMRANGFNPEEVDDVTFEDLAIYETGEPITETGPNPVTMLAQDTSTGGVFAIEDGMRRAVRSREILAARFAGWPITPLPAAAIAAYPAGEAMTFPDGTLIKAHGSPDVFVVSEGQRRPIADERTFLAYGWRWDAIISTDERSVLLQPLGPAIDLKAEEAAEEPLLVASE